MVSWKYLINENIFITIIQYKLETSFLNVFYFFNLFAGCKVPYKRVAVEGGIYKRVY